MAHLVYDPPTEFDALPPQSQQALRLWVRLALEPASRFALERGRWHSYNLKHHAERALGWYVSNGEMKGALLAEGYAYQVSTGSPNWLFKCRRRCPHRMGRAVIFEYHDYRGTRRQATEYGFACPGALWCDSLYRNTLHVSGEPGAVVTGTYPALCQATPAELAEFDRLRHAAVDERKALRAQPS